MIKITSTELKQNTRKVLKQLKETGEPIVVYTYGEPEAILHKYNSHKIKRKPTLKELEKYMFKGKGKKKIDTTAMIRRMRDEE